MSSAAQEDWTGMLAITGMGLVTPVGLRAESSCAAMRAGVSRLSTIEGFSIQVSENESDDVIGARVPVVTDQLLGAARLRAMMKPALKEAIEDAELTDERLGVFLGTSGSSPAGRVLNYDAQVKESLLASVPETIRLERAKLVQCGRASVQRSIRLAAQALENDLIDVAIIGASDSWVTPRALEWQANHGRLPAYPRHTGTIPAEAAGFLVLETPESASKRGADTYAHIVASAGRQEPARWGEAMPALPLAEALSSVIGNVDDSHAIVVSDLDGDRYRAMEWSMAEIKAMWPSETQDHWNPVDCVGDSGAAMGAVMLAWASTALHRGYAGTPHILLWGASDEGAREAVMLRQVRGTD